MFFSYVNCQRSQMYNSVLTNSFPRMSLKTFKKIALSGLKLFGCASWFLTPKTPLLVFKHCFQHILWCDFFFVYILRFFHDRHASKVGSCLRKKRREMHNLVLYSVYKSSYIFLILFFIYLFIYLIIYLYTNLPTERLYF